MSREDFVAVAARLFALYVLFLIVQSIPTAIPILSQSSGGTALFIGVLAACLAFIAFLWFFPLTIARKLLPVMREPRSEQSLDASTALSVGVTLIGLWFLANAFADLSYCGILLIRVAQDDLTGFEWSHEQVAGMATTVVELAIALFLVLGSSGIKQLVYRYRYGDAR